MNGDLISWKNRGDLHFSGRGISYEPAWERTGLWARLGGNDIRSAGIFSGKTALEVFNTDQGSQFTPARFTDMLQACLIRISVDGRGRWLDNERWPPFFGQVSKL